MPPRRRLVAFALVPFVLAVPAVFAQVGPSTLETTVVTATRTERAALDVPASVDVIDRDEVRDAQWRVNLSIIGPAEGTSHLRKILDNGQK